MLLLRLILQWGASEKRLIALVFGLNFDGRTNIVGRKALRAILNQGGNISARRIKTLGIIQFCAAGEIPARH